MISRISVWEWSHLPEAHMGTMMQSSNYWFSGYTRRDRTWSLSSSSSQSSGSLKDAAKGNKILRRVLEYGGLFSELGTRSSLFFLSLSLFIFLFVCLGALILIIQRKYFNLSLYFTYKTCLSSKKREPSFKRGVLMKTATTLVQNQTKPSDLTTQQYTMSGQIEINILAHKWNRVVTQMEEKQNCYAIVVNLSSNDLKYTKLPNLRAVCFYLRINFIFVREVDEAFDVTKTQDGMN